MDDRSPSKLKFFIISTVLLFILFTGLFGFEKSTAYAFELPAVSNLFNLFLHVLFASLGAIFWCLGIAILYVMYQSGRILDLNKIAFALLAIGGVFFTLMQSFGSIVYSPYALQVSPFLRDHYPILKTLFDYKLLLINIPSTIIGIGAIAFTLVAHKRRDVTLSLILSTAVIALFGIGLILATLVTSTYSI